MTVQARTWVFDVLMNSPELAEHVGNRIFSASSMGVDPDAPAPQRPFLIYRSELSTPIIRGAKSCPFTFYVHDEQGSYLNHIEPCLTIIIEAFEARGSQLWQGKQMFAGEWSDSSGDLYDDMFSTAVRYATINVVTSS